MKGKGTSHIQLQGSLVHAPLTSQDRPALLVAFEPRKGVHHPLPQLDVVQQLWLGYNCRHTPSSPESTKAAQVHLKMCRLAIPTNISDCSRGG